VRAHLCIISRTLRRTWLEAADVHCTPSTLLGWRLQRVETSAKAAAARGRSTLDAHAVQRQQQQHRSRKLGKPGAAARSHWLAARIRRSLQHSSAFRCSLRGPRSQAPDRSVSASCTAGWWCASPTARWCARWPMPPWRATRSSAPPTGEHTVLACLPGACLPVSRPTSGGEGVSAGDGGEEEEPGWRRR
jgi:hypothetical protein